MGERRLGLNLQKKDYDQCDAIKMGTWFVERQRFQRMKEGAAS